MSQIKVINYASLIILLIIELLCSTANATVFSFTQNYNQMIDNTTKDFTLDLNEYNAFDDFLLDDGSMYQLNGASLILSFIDDDEDSSNFLYSSYFTGSPVSHPVYCTDERNETWTYWVNAGYIANSARYVGDNNGIRTNEWDFYRRYQDVFQEEGETATITVGNQTIASGSVTYATADSWVKSQYEILRGYWYNTYTGQHILDIMLNFETDYRLINYYQYDSWTKPFTLNDTALNDLAMDGILNINLQALGDLNFSSATILVDADETPIPPEPSATPEPTTMLLFGFGLLGLAGVSRKRLQK